MARTLDAKCRMCRRAGTKLFLKGERCFTPKCAIVKRNYPPGVQGAKRARPRLTSYAIQLKEKQKCHHHYRISEKQMSNYFTKAVRKQGDTGLFMQQMLEQRLDNAVYRLGLARSRDEARQTVGHGFILVNGRKVSIPSYQAKVGDRITLKKGAETSKRFQELPQLQDKESEKLPSWLIRESQFEGKVVGLPQGDDLAAPFDMKIIVEFYSR
ncbi:30S ribosomal protein S4 [Candidatus Uhrbacteria bacterium]|nr:30S ribosomal protein S4 [Candidatus Uhrbacteria bacterium]